MWTFFPSFQFCCQTEIPNIFTVLLLRSQCYDWPSFYHLTVFLPIISLGFHTFAPLQTGWGDCLPSQNNCRGIAVPYSKLLVMSSSHHQCLERTLLFARMRAPFSAEPDVDLQALSLPANTGIHTETPSHDNWQLETPPLVFEPTILQQQGTSKSFLNTAVP